MVHLGNPGLGRSGPQSYKLGVYPLGEDIPRYIASIYVAALQGLQGLQGLQALQALQALPGLPSLPVLPSLRLVSTAAVIDYSPSTKKLQKTLKRQITPKISS